jgi:hypothetical protein
LQGDELCNSYIFTGDCFKPLTLHLAGLLRIGVALAMMTTTRYKAFTETAKSSGFDPSS